MSACRHGAALYSDRETANNNQFNYPQNIYCGTGFVMQTQRRRVVTTSDFLLHSARPFSRRFVVVIAWFSVCCFTRPSYQCGFSGCAAASIYTYHPDLRWVCHICCFIFCFLLGAMDLFFKGPVWPPSRNSGITWRFFGHLLCVCVCVYVCVCVILHGFLALSHVCAVLITHSSCLCSSAADARASGPAQRWWHEWNCVYFCAHIQPPLPGKTDLYKCPRVTCHSLV